MSTPDEGTPEPPVCPRHPDRVSYVSCQRCGRPACPECQRPAAVGVHCVDCVRASAASRREAVSVVGARVKDGPPVVTYAIIGLTALVFLLQYVPVLGVTERLGYAPVMSVAEPWRFVTAALVHSTGFVLHIGFNMLALWTFGQYLEPLLGRWRFALSYVLCAAGGSVAVLAFASPADIQDWVTLTVGASGAVFGLFGVALLTLRRSGQNPTSLLVMIALNFGIGFFLAGVSWEAHLGGLVTGLLLGCVLVLAPRAHRAAVQAAGFAVVAALLVAVVVGKIAVGAGVAAPVFA